MATEQDVLAGENIEGKTDVKSREKRFDQQREKSKRILHYLCHGKYMDGLFHVSFKMLNTRYKLIINNNYLYRC